MGVIVRLLMAAAIGCVVTGLAQAAGPVRLHGKVVSDNHSPVRGATVAVLYGADRVETTTGPSGEFDFDLKVPGEYLLEAQQEGYYRLRKHPVQAETGDNEVTLILNLQRE